MSAPRVEAESDVARRLQEWSERPSRTRVRAKTISNSAFEKAERETDRMMASGEWDDAMPRHFVCLYAMLHERVYGVSADDLTGTTRVYAAGLASKLLASHFGGDPCALAEFIRWSWQREKSREEWRRANGVEGRRMHWRWQFGLSMVTDYRRVLASKSGR